MRWSDRMPEIELIWERDCPNVEPARTVLADALAETGLPQHWLELRIGDRGIPAHARGYGSPTILVNGRDVTGSAPGSSDCCRVYSDVSGVLRGVPPTEQVVAALAEAMGLGASSGLDHA